MKMQQEASEKCFFYTQPSLPAKNSIFSLPESYSLCHDTRGGIWLGTNGKGLRYLDRKTETFTDYKHIPGEENSLSSNHIHSLYCDLQGMLWIGTNAGLDRYDRQTGQFEHLTTQQGLASNSIQGILPGEAGVLFIFTNKGISRMDVNSREIVNYSIANGLLSDEFTEGVCCKRKSGELVSGSHAGLLSFRPENITSKLNETPPKVLITHSLEETQGSRTLHISFVTFHYTHPQAIRYQYMLKGYDTGWKEADAGQQDVTYRQLSSGNYSFEVRASVNGTCWNEPAILNIKIRPPWWQTWWFIALVGSMASALAYLFYKKRGNKDTVGQPRQEEGITVIQDTDNDFIIKATKVVTDNLQNLQFDVDTFCSQMAMSRASLFRKLKSTTGCSASSFTRNIRIKEAAELLSRQRYTIGEVALMVGFSDPNYFSRCFKEVYGMTPSEFINELKGTPPTNI